MQRLCLPLVDLLAYNGETLNAPLVEALADMRVSPELVRAQAQRLADVFAGRRPDHTPFLSDLRWWVAERYHDGTLHRDISGHDFEKLLCWSITPVPPQPRPAMESIPGVREEVTWSGPPVIYTHGGFPGHKRTVTISTRVGTLQASEAYASRSFGVIDHPVKTVKDLTVVRHIMEQQAKYGKQPLPSGWLALPPLTPLQMFLVHLAGVSRGVFMILEARAEVESFFRFCAEMQHPVMETLARQNKVLLSVENLSSEISGGYWDRYLGPQLAARSDIARKHGAVYGIHQDGKLIPLIGRLQEARVGYVNGVTALPSGDADPLRLREMAGPELVIQDILPQCIFSPYFEEEKFRQYADRVVSFYRNDSRIILGIGDLLPVDGLLGRVQYVCERIEQA